MPIAEIVRLVLANIRPILLACAVILGVFLLWQYIGTTVDGKVAQTRSQEAVEALQTQEQARIVGESAVRERDTQRDVILKDRYEARKQEELTKETHRAWSETPLPEPARTALRAAAGLPVPEQASAPSAP